MEAVQQTHSPTTIITTKTASCISRFWEALMSLSVSGAGLVWGRRRDRHRLRRALRHPPHPHCKCCRRGVAGQWACTCTRTRTRTCARAGRNNCSHKDTYLHLNAVFYTLLNRLLNLVTVTHNKSHTSAIVSFMKSTHSLQRSSQELKVQGKSVRAGGLGGWGVLPWRFELPCALLRYTLCNPQ